MEDRLMQPSWTKAPDATRREAQDQDNKDCDLAVKALDLAVKRYADVPDATNKVVTDTAEWYYRWITSENELSMIWKEPEDWEG